MFSLAWLLTICTFLSNHANAFPQARRRSVSSSQRGVDARLSTQIRLSNECNDVIKEPIGSDNQTTRRHVLQKSMYSLGLALAATSANPERGNAIEFGLPNILLSADGDNKAVKGMPAPIKKSSGLGYKIRAVSKVMVSKSSTIVSRRSSGHVTCISMHLICYLLFCPFQRMSSNEI